MDTDLIPASEMKSIFKGTTDQYWAALRHKGGGPDYLKLVRKVYYRRTDIEAWIEGNRFTRTGDRVNASHTDDHNPRPGSSAAPSKTREAVVAERIAELDGGVR